MLRYRAKRVFGIITISRRNRTNKTISLSDLAQKKSPNLRKQQLFDNFLVLDFEASCEKFGRRYPQEIIEFPAFKVNGATFEIEDEFHSFVRPTFNPTLSNYCSQLTGISQATVDSKPDFEEVLKLFDNWMEEKVLLPDHRSIFVTSGDWDLMLMLPNECRRRKLDIPGYFTPYININKSFAHATGKWPRFGKGRLHAMLKLLDLEVVGPLHQGTSDCKNIIRVMKALSERGHVFQPTSHIKTTIDDDVIEHEDVIQTR